MIYYFISGLIFAFAIYLAWLGSTARRMAREINLIEDTFDPKPLGRFKTWLCGFHKHEGNAWHLIENNQGVRKFRCGNCEAIFLQGKRRIRKIMIGT